MWNVRGYISFNSARVLSWHSQLQSLVDFRTQLSATDYGNFLANEPLPISTSTISDKATQILVEQFNYLLNNAVQPLSKFLEYITYDFFSYLSICILPNERISVMRTWLTTLFYLSQGLFTKEIHMNYLSDVIPLVYSILCLLYAWPQTWRNSTKASW